MFLSRFKFLQTAFLTSTSFPHSIIGATSAGVTKSKNLTTSAATTCIATSMNSRMLEDFPIGLGTFEIQPDQIPTAISSAIRLGYKRIDCAPGTTIVFF
jgi:hypothetical protein